MNERGGIGIGGIIVLAVIGFWLYGSVTGGDDSSSEPWRNPAVEENERTVGDPAVHRRIARMTDCTKLQREFDIADENHRRESRAGNIDVMLIVSSYMSAADDRMRQIGCYG